LAEVILVTGGARSGKSRFAEQLLSEYTPEQAPALYVATAQAFDDEMRQRIALHRERRPKHWRTVESPLFLTEAVLPYVEETKAVLLDCITLYLSNLLLMADVETLAANSEQLELAAWQEISSLIALCRQHDVHLIMVTNEVGMGVVPPSLLGRVFRDISGFTNQRIAQTADHVFLLTAGLPFALKG